MNDIERMLASARRAPPSPDLDRRVEQLLSAAPARSPFARPVALWKAAAMLALAATAAFLGGRWSATEPAAPPQAAAPAVYIVQGGLPASAYDVPVTTPGFLDSPGHVRIQIIQPEAPGEI